MPFTLILRFEGDDRLNLLKHSYQRLNLLEHSYQIDRKLQNIIAPSFPLALDLNLVSLCVYNLIYILDYIHTTILN